MRILPATLALLFLVSSTLQPAFAQSDDAAKAQEIIDKAVKAIGGGKGIDKTSAFIVEETGTYYGMGQGIPFQGRYAFDLKKRRFRMEIIGFFISVIDGDKGWMSAMGEVSDVEGEALKNGIEGTLVQQAMSLLPLRKPNSKYKLGLAGEEDVEGEKCDGVTVDHDGMPTLTMFFSRKSGLMKKSRHKTRASEEGFKEVTDESIYHEYKEFEGVQNAARYTIFRDGKKFIEASPTKVTYPGSVGDDEFKKPE